MRDVADRLACARAILERRPEVRHVGALGGLGAAGAWYGWSRRRVSRRFRREPLGGGLDWIDVGPFGLAWPAAAPVGRLAASLVELWAPSNSHYYFDPLTPLRPGSVVLDVGACEGGFAMECLVRHRAACVYAFEPGPRMAAALRVTAERNGVAAQLRVVEAACARVTGTVDFVESAENPLVSKVVPSASSTGVVRQLSVDDWVRNDGIPRVDFIKVDAEGSDVAVLEGAETTLRRDRPALAVTSYHAPEHANVMVDFLHSLRLGYRVRVKGVVAIRRVARPVMVHATCARS